MRRHDRAVPHPIGARRLADNLPEGSAERPEAGETDSEADVGDSAVSLTQEKHRALDPPPLQVAMGRLTVDGAEAAAEVIARLARSAAGRPGFLWARSILKSPAWHAEVSRQLREKHPGLPVEVVDPHTFFGLIKADRSLP